MGMTVVVSIDPVADRERLALQEVMLPASTVIDIIERDKAQRHAEIAAMQADALERGERRGRLYLGCELRADPVAVLDVLAVAIAAFSPEARLALDHLRAHVVGDLASLASPDVDVRVGPKWDAEAGSHGC